MSEKITFKELVEKISKSTSQSEQKTNSFIHELTGIIESGLEKGEKITIAGFGKFELRWMDSRKGHNPQTGEEITIPGQNKVYFKSYKDLEEHVNEPFQKLEPKIIDESHGDPAPPKTSDSKEKNQSVENIEDLIKERPSPVKSKVPANFRRADSPEENREMFSDPVPVSTSENSGMADSINKEKNVQGKKDEKKFYWPYIASAAVLLVILLFIFWILRTGDVTDDIVRDAVDPAPTEQFTPPAESTPAVPDEAEADPSEMDVYSISSGETLWTIADQNYGDPYLWPIIFEQNSEEIENPDFITAGSSIHLPNLTDSANLTPNDRQKVARGYLYVYDWMTNHQPDNARYYLWAVGAYSQEELQRVSARVNESDLAFATQR